MLTVPKLYTNTPISNMIAYITNVFAAWKFNLNISNATTSAMHHQGSFNIRQPLPPIPPSEKHECAAYLMAHTQSLYVPCMRQSVLSCSPHPWAQHNRISLYIFNRGWWPNIYVIVCTIPDTVRSQKGSGKMKSNTFIVTHQMQHFLYPSASLAVVLN